MRFILPWKCINSKFQTYIRREIGSIDNGIIATVYQISGAMRKQPEWDIYIDRGYLIGHLSPEEAMKRADDILRDNGDYLIEECDVERFRRIEILM